MGGQQKTSNRGKGRTRKSGSPGRISSYKHQFDRTAKNKDRNVRRSSHGKFKSAADLDAHRKKKAEAKTKRKLPQFKGRYIDITGGVESSEYVRNMRDNVTETN